MSKDLWQSIVKSPITQKQPERKKQDKRNKLVVAAKSLIHKKGFGDTTLADIAHEAEVPLGNVYYYFKTKEAIGLAVIEQRFKDWNLWVKQVISQPLILSRLILFLENFMCSENETDTNFPMGHLCEEFAREGGALAAASKKFLTAFVEWLEEQFRLCGLAEHALPTAYTFLSMAQGSMILGKALQNAELIVQQRDRIESWLKQIDRQNVKNLSFLKNIFPEKTLT